MFQRLEEKPCNIFLWEGLARSPTLAKQAVEVGTRIAAVLCRQSKRKARELYERELLPVYPSIYLPERDLHRSMNL